MLLRRCTLLVVLPLLLACAPAVRSPELPAVVTERLYFGRNVDTTLGVSDSVWASFVKEVVSVRLSGFTYWAAQGGWRDSTGRQTQEPSFVLEVVHAPRSASVDSAIVLIIAEYKRRFKQQSVLRVVTPGRATF